MSKRITSHPASIRTANGDTLRKVHVRPTARPAAVGAQNGSGKDPLSALMALIGDPNSDSGNMSDEPTGPVGTVAERTEAVHQRADELIQGFMNLGQEDCTIEALATRAFADWLTAQHQLNFEAANTGFRLFEQGASIEGGPEHIVQVALSLTGDLTPPDVERIVRKELGVAADWQPSRAPSGKAKTGT